jgi:nucleoside-diphosphate-sugar epimerase
VTGCAGFIGSTLVESLLAQGARVHGIDNFSDYYPRATKEANLRTALSDRRFTFTESDLVSAPLDPLVNDVTGVFHLAAQPGVRGSWGQTFEVYVRDNIVATQRIFEAAARSAARVVFASSSSIYGDAEALPTSEGVRPAPVSPYGVTKLTCESLATTYAKRGLTVITLRYFTVYGPRQRPDMAFARLIAAALQGKPFVLFGDGLQSRDFTYVDDALSATIKAMERAPSGAAYNIGGGTRATLQDVIQMCERLTGHSVQLVVRETAAGDVRHTAADTTRARSELGWSPTIPLEEGLARQLEWSSDATQRH